MASVTIPWATFKAENTRRSTVIQMIETPEIYYLIQFDGDLELVCQLPKAEGLDLTDFETNYKAATNKSPIQQKPFADALGFRARLTGYTGTALANTSTNIDIPVTEEKWINGGAVLVQDQGPRDTLDFSIVDVNNVLGYGAGMVLDKFVSNWNVSADKESQATYMIPYPAKIIPGLAIRLTYRSTNMLKDTLVKINLFLHKKT